MRPEKHIVMYSGGVTSWAAGKRAIERYGKDSVVLVFADTLIEDEDLYRFLDETEEAFETEIVRLKEGRNPWEIFHKERFLGNSRIDPCSKLLKRKFIRRWVEKNFDAADTTIHLGMDWMEMHRLKRTQPYWEPYTVEAPLLWEPILGKAQVFKMLEAEGIKPPRLYEMGFQHNNCGGFCVKAGQAAFKHLLTEMPERYAYHEKEEQKLREFLGKDVAILRDTKKEGRPPLTMRDFRLRLTDERAGQTFMFDETDWGSCSCFFD